MQKLFENPSESFLCLIGWMFFQNFLIKSNLLFIFVILNKTK